MLLSQLLDLLQEMQQDLPDGVDPEVKLAVQPRWAFAHHVGEVVLVDNTERDEEDGTVIEQGAPVVYIGEGGQDGYLPGEAANALGWGRG
jgi:hypothetical protein